MLGKIALLTPPTISHRTAEETLALGYLASVLREAGFQVVVVDTWLRGIGSAAAVDLAFEGGAPSVVGLSCYRSNLPQAKEIVEAVKARSSETVVIGGGYGPTFHDEDFLRAGFDIVVRGETEHLIVELVKTILERRDLAAVPGISFWKDHEIVRTKRSLPLSNLDLLPFPARDEAEITIRRKNPMHLCTSRGCNGSCSFCSIAAFSHGVRVRPWRGRSVEDIVVEIETLHKRFGATYFKFVDDSFLEPPRDEAWARSFYEALRKKGLRIRFRTQIRADRLTEDLARYLKAAGWFATSIGVENFSATALARMRKTASVEDNLRALDILRRQGIYTQAGLILFDPATTFRELEENCLALEKQSWITTKGIFAEMFAAVGTTFTDKLQATQLLRQDPGNQNCHYEIADPLARRVYGMLKAWHKSHAALYDWVIDSLTAPKILSEHGYAAVHKLCRRLLVLDVKFFKKSLIWIGPFDPATDVSMVKTEVLAARSDYQEIQDEIAKIYRRENLVYDGVFNPFL